MDPSLEAVLELIDEAQYDTALDVLRDMAPDRFADDDRVEYLRCLAQCLSHTDRFADAERVLHDGLAEFPEDPRLLCELGIVLSESGREAEAQMHFETVAAVAPDDAGIAYHYGYVLEKLHCLEEAAAQYRRVLELDPSYDWAHLRLAECLADMGEDEAAVAAYEEYLRRCPTDGGAWVGLGILHSDATQYDEASRCYQEAEGLQCDCEDLYYNWFVTALRQGKMDVAAQKLEGLKADDPDGSRVLFAEAYMAQRSNDLEMTRLYAWQAVGRGLSEGEERSEEGMAAAMAIFCEHRWVRDAEKLFERAAASGLFPEGLLAPYNELKHDRIAKGVWCALVVSAQSVRDADTDRRYLRSYEVEAADLITAEALAMQMEQCLGGVDCRVECVEETQNIGPFHPGVVWADRVVRAPEA